MLRLRAAGLASALLLLAPAAAQAEDLEFLLTNLSDSSVVGFYVSPTDTDRWEENLIAGGYLPSGNEIDVVIADGADTCMYDIRTEFEDGETTEDYDLDLCELGEYTFR